MPTNSRAVVGSTQHNRAIRCDMPQQQPGMKAMAIGGAGQTPEAISAVKRQKRLRRAEKQAQLVPNSPVVIALIVLIFFLALAATSSWSKVRSLELELARLKTHHDRHEDRAKLCGQVMGAKLAAMSPNSSQPAHAKGPARSTSPPPTTTQTQTQTPPQTPQQQGPTEVDGHKQQHAEQEDHHGLPAVAEPANDTKNTGKAVERQPETAAAAEPPPVSEVVSSSVTTSASALIFVVGHLRHFEDTLGAHRKLVQSVEKTLGAAPAVCIATYPQRDHHDRTWWHGGDQTHDTSVHVDPAAVATSYGVPLSQVQMLEPSSVQNPAKYMVSAICHHDARP